MDNVKKVYCHHCGMVRENPSLPKCPGCGTLFVKVCSRCGAPVKKDRENCIKCGLAINNMVAPMPGMRIVSESEQIKPILSDGDKKRKVPTWVIVLLIIFCIIATGELFESNRKHSEQVEREKNIETAQYESAYNLANDGDEKRDILVMNAVSLSVKDIIETNVYEGNSFAVKRAWIMDYDGPIVLLELDNVDNVPGMSGIYGVYEIFFSLQYPDGYCVTREFTKNMATTDITPQMIMNSYILSEENIKIINKQINSDILKDGDYILENKYYNYFLKE